MDGGGGGGGGQQTVTQVQQIPEWQKEYAQENERIAASLASQPYPNYTGQLIAGFAPRQQQGMQMAEQAASAYVPNLYTAEMMTAGGARPWGPEAAMQYMSPFAMAAMAPQIQQLKLKQSQDQKGIDAGATHSGAFGDARHGVADAMNNFYSDLALSDLVSQGMNQAYNTGMGAHQGDMARLMGAGQQFGQLAGQQQQLGVTGANALFNAGTQQQQLTQQQLKAAYSNFMNQVNWPREQLNLRIASLANSPYSVTNHTTLPPSNATAMNVGAFGALAGGLGSLMNGGQSGGGGPNIWGSA